MQQVLEEHMFAYDALPMLFRVLGAKWSSVICMFVCARLYVMWMAVQLHHAPGKERNSQ